MYSHAFKLAIKIVFLQMFLGLTMHCIIVMSPVFYTCVSHGRYLQA